MGLGGCFGCSWALLRLGWVGGRREGKRWGAMLNIWCDEFCLHGAGRDSSEASGRHVYIHGKVKEVSENWAFDGVGSEILRQVFDSTGCIYLEMYVQSRSRPLLSSSSSSAGA